MKSRKTKFVLLILLLCCFCQPMFAQENKQKVRLAKLVIDSSNLGNYTAALKEEIENSIRLEPGVLTLYAVAEKDHPTHITILEISCVFIDVDFLS